MQHLERNADIWRPLTGKNCAAVACGAGKGYRVVDAAIFMLPGGFCGNNGKLFTVAVIFSHFASVMLILPNSTVSLPLSELIETIGSQLI